MSCEDGSARSCSGLLSHAFVLTRLSLSLNVKQQHSGLWLLCLHGECAGCGCTVVSGVAGSKDKFSLAEM